MIRARGLKKSRVAHVRTHTAPLAGSVPAFALPATADLGSTYTSFSLTGRRFFDSIFAYTAMALVPARLNAVDGAPVSGLQGHNVGAGLASSDRKSTRLHSSHIPLSR